MCGPVMAWLLVASLLLGGCTIVRLNAQTQAFDASTVLVGRVEPGPDSAGPMVVGAYSRDDAGRWSVEHQVRLHESGA